MFGDGAGAHQGDADVDHFGAAAVVGPGDGVFNKDGSVVTLAGLVYRGAWAVGIAAAGDYDGVHAGGA